MIVGLVLNSLGRSGRRARGRPRQATAGSRSMSGVRPRRPSAAGMRDVPRARVPGMWDVLKWQHDTLSIAWWALVVFAVLVFIAAGSRAAKR
jgi:hypothetical protein